MAKGSRGGRRERGGNLNPADIVKTELMTWSGKRSAGEQDFFNVTQDLHGLYGNDVLPQDFLVLATLKGASAATTMGYYDGSNVALNKRFMERDVLDKVYAADVAENHHPKLGNRSAAEAVAAHELGHRLTDAAAERLGMSMDGAATKIVRDALANAKAGGGISDKRMGVVQFERSISRYATVNDKEGISEAFADVYCNGRRASLASKYIVDELNNYFGIASGKSRGAY